VAGVPIFTAVVRRGALQVDGRGYQQWLESLEGRRVEIVVRKRRKKRSLQCERYYRGVILPALVEATGYTAAEMHYLMKALFLQPFGMESMADLDWRDDTMEQQLRFVESCIWFAAWLDVIIPPANRVWA